MAGLDVYVVGGLIGCCLYPLGFRVLHELHQWFPNGSERPESEGDDA